MDDSRLAWIICIEIECFQSCVCVCVCSSARRNQRLHRPIESIYLVNVVVSIDYFCPALVQANTPVHIARSSWPGIGRKSIGTGKTMITVMDSVCLFSHSGNIG